MKFLVTSETGSRIRAWARRHLEPDPHGAGACGDEYRTSSVYFDTDPRDVFHRRGSYGRSKYRIRRYGDAPVAFVERKLREPGVLAKRRTAVALESLCRLDAAPGTEGWPGDWFERRVRIRNMRPVCRISYSRTARFLTRDGAAMRLTLDEALVVAPASRVAFGSDGEIAMLEGLAILELKFGGDLPALFKRLVEELALEPGRVSKYRSGMAALSGGQLTIEEGGEFAFHA